MQRPEVPRAWRLATGGAGAILLLGAATGDAPNVYSPVLLGIVGLALAFAMARGRTRDQLAAFAGIGIAIIFAIVTQDPFGILFGLGIGVPAALVAARPHPIATFVTAIGLGVTLFGLSLLLRERGPMTADLEMRGLIISLSFVALALGLVLHAALARSEVRGAAFAGLSRRALVSYVALGAILLGLAWLMGGYVIGFLPIWPFALAALVLPPAISWRAWPAGAIAVAVVALAGAAPVGTCTADPFSDAIGPGDPAADARPRLVLLGEVGTRGPDWASGDGFSGERVTCAPLLLGLGAGWAIALVGAATVFAFRPTGKAPSRSP